MKRCITFLMVFGFVALSGVAVAEGERPGRGAPTGVSKGERKAVKPVKQGAATTKFTHEEWGQTFYGEGYVYGPTNRRSGMAVTDYDLDGDTDFAFPNVVGSPVIMRNLGSSSAFYPGGSKDLVIQGLPAKYSYSLSMDFEDLNGDTLPDLLAIVQQEGPFLKGVVWFQNMGPRDAPVFQYKGLVYLSGQEGLWPGMWVDSGDADGDGKVEVIVAEDFVADAPPYHRVFKVANTGTATAPIWAAPTQVVKLSNLLPDRIALKSLEKTTAGAVDAKPLLQLKAPGSAAKQGGFTYNLGDIDLVDWDEDGDLDFMFYDKSQGLMWVKNIGTAGAWSWDSVLGDNGVPIYDHRITDELDYAEGTFGLSANPDAAKPGTEWSRDVYISVNSRLKAYRYYLEDSAYRLVQTNAVAFPAGQANCAFWDYDQDGDRDLFRMGVSDTADTNILLFPNIGVPYAPAWGDFFSLLDLPLNEGNAGNVFRNDVYVFADHDVDGDAELFVQKQDGTVSEYAANPSANTDTAPTFTLLDTDFGFVVAPGHTGIIPNGLAIADFDYFSDGWSELIAVYAHSGGANIVVWDILGDIIRDVPNLFPSPSGTGTLDPVYIESIASGDLTGDGVPDLVVSYSDDTDYYEVKHLVYRTVTLDVDPNLELAFELEYEGELSLPYATDKFHARMPTLEDVDADGDMDLFIGHRYDNSSHLQPYIRFYRNNNPASLEFWRTRTVANQSWNFLWNDALPNYDFIVNASSATIQNPGNYITGPYAPTVDVIQSTDLDPNVRIFLDVLPEVGATESKAIIIVGDTADGTMYPTFSAIGGIAYYVLLSEGLPAANIRFLADADIDGDGDGVNDVFNKPTLARIQNSIVNWAQGTDRLLVYMVDHGRRDSFRVNGTEFLAAADYAAWVAQLQAASGTHVTTLIDTCEAGSFVDDLAGANRITMTSSGQGPIEGIALFDQTRLISFSLNFWEEIFNGANYGQAFDSAKIAIEAINPLQTALIDDDGDGVPNEGNDGFAADAMRPGADFDLKGPNVFIGDVAPNQAITANSAQLWLADVVSVFPVEEAGALVVPPNFQRPSLGGDDEQPVTGLDWVSFTWNVAQNRWQGTYPNFAQGGLFQIQYFVKAGGRWVASPRIGFVDRLGIPDAWETDNSPATSNWLPINSVQGHNFHTASDADWVRFVSPLNQEATIAVIAPRPNCQPVVELFKVSDVEVNASASPVRRVAAPHPGAEVVFKQFFNATEPYLIRVSNLDGTKFGEGTSYLLLLAVGTGGTQIIPTTLVVTVAEQGVNTPLGNAAVSFAGSSIGKTTSDGVAQTLVAEYGTYTVAGSKEGYVNGSQSVQVNNNLESVTVYLTKEPVGEGEGEGEGEGAAEGEEEGEGEGEGSPEPPPACGCGPAQETGGGIGGDAVVVAAVMAMLLAGAKRRKVVKV